MSRVFLARRSEVNFSFSTSIPALILAVWLLYEVLRAVAAK